MINMYYKVMDVFLFSLPVPMSINYLSGVGSMLGLCLGVQLVSGFVLSLFYSSGVESSFSSVMMIMMDVSNGWVIRYVHSLGASLMMMMVYLHVLRGLWYGSYKLISVWVVGVLIVVVVSVVSFLGYVLPWGQMSYWAATVITSMLTALPYVGVSMSEWLWGSYSVSESTLVRFFSLHYIMSLVVVFMVFLHLINLHEVGSSNPVGAGSNLDKLSFHVLFSYKDMVGVVFILWLYIVGVFLFPLLTMDSVNFEVSNIMKTPEHIKPEWYFLYAYCVLRSISSKLGGVIMMVFSMIVLLLPSVSVVGRVLVSGSCWLGQIFVVVYVWSFVVLSVLGGCMVEYPYDMLGVVATVVYFISMMLVSLLASLVVV